MTKSYKISIIDSFMLRRPHVMSVKNKFVIGTELRKKPFRCRKQETLTSYELDTDSHNFLHHDLYIRFRINNIFFKQCVWTHARQHRQKTTRWLTGVSSAGSRWKCNSCLQIAIFTCIKANPIPMQFQGPSPKSWSIRGSILVTCSILKV